LEAGRFYDLQPVPRKPALNTSRFGRKWHECGDFSTVAVRPQILNPLSAGHEMSHFGMNAGIIFTGHGQDMESRGGAKTHRAQGSRAF